MNHEYFKISKKKNLLHKQHFYLLSSHFYYYLVNDSCWFTQTMNYFSSSKCAVFFIFGFILLRSQCDQNLSIAVVKTKKKQVPLLHRMKYETLNKPNRIPTKMKSTNKANYFENVSVRMHLIGIALIESEKTRMWYF